MTEGVLESGPRVGLRAERAVATVTWRLLMSGRRWIGALVASGLPALGAWLFFAEAGPSDPERLATFFGGFMNAIVLTILLPLMGLVHGTAAFGIEVEDGTLRYLLAKPVARWRIVHVKWGVAAAATTVSVLPGVVAAGWILMGAPTDPAVLGMGAAVVVGAALYAAVFMSLGLVTRRALILGLLYLLAWEGTLGTLFSGVRVFSIREYAAAAARAVAGDELRLGLEAALEPGRALLLGLVVLALALGFAVHRLRGLELVEEA